MKWSDAELEQFEEESFRKRVLHTDKEELLRILKGERATKVYTTPGERKGLRDRGILEVRYKMGGKYLAVSNRAQQLLMTGEKLEL